MQQVSQTPPTPVALGEFVAWEDCEAAPPEPPQALSSPELLSPPSDADELTVEVAHRLSFGQRRVSMAEMAALIGQYGYRFDRTSDCRSRTRVISGPMAGHGYSALSLRPVQQDNGIGWCSIDARRDANLHALQALRSTVFAVSRGAIADW